MLSGGGNAFTWNARNQVATLNSVSLQYDAFGRRVKNAGGTSFLYDEANAVQELSGATVTANLLSGGVDEIFSRANSIGSFAQLKDALGSAIALVDYSGNVQTTYTYDPYGGTSVTGTSNANEFQYTGRENETTGLYYYRARYYSPLLARFFSEDPLGFAGSGPNFYGYAFNNPVSLRDPSGLDGNPMPSDIMPLPSNDSRSGNSSRGNVLQQACIWIPDGRTVGVSGGIGITGGQTGGLEVLVNYNTGQIGGFAYGGLQAGLNGGLQGSVNTGFVWSLGDSNSNYSGPFTGAQAYAGPIGIYTAASSGGFAHPLTMNWSAPNSVGVSLGKGLAPIPIGGGVSETYYSKPLDMGNIFDPWHSVNPANLYDQSMFLIRQLCR